MTLHDALPDPDLVGEALERVLLTISASDCDHLPKVPEAGKVVVRDGVPVQVMHNGLVVEAGGYFGSWMSEIIRLLRGHHEPQEERVVAAILERLRATGDPSPTAVELGAFWAYYSLWFLHELPEGCVVALEPDPENLALGRRNFTLNRREGTFVHGVMGASASQMASFVNLDGTTSYVREYTLPELLAETGVERVDLLLCDIQGGEKFVFSQAESLLRGGAVRFAVISTHHHSISGDPLTHQTLLRELQELGAHVIAEHTVGESCSGDGLIAVSFDPADSDFIVSTSRVRQGDALFGPLEVDLAAAQAHSRVLEQQLEQARAVAAAVCDQLDAFAAQLAAARADLELIRNSKLWRWSGGARSVYSRVRFAIGRKE